MPTYSYYCSACDHELEAFQKITAEPLHECPKCHKESLVRRPAGGVGLSFNGDGFYKTMYGPQPSSEKSSNGGDCCPCGKNKGPCGS